jgi:hypothetical protein
MAYRKHNVAVALLLFTVWAVESGYTQSGGIGQGPGAAPAQANRGEQVMKAFEAYGFIWGGKWMFYDTMHFEYRPEILLLSNMSVLTN